MARERSRATSAGVAAGVFARTVRYARQVDWPAVWVRARWLTHHTQRLYNNLSEEERREFLEIVVPTRSSRFIAREDRPRIVELVTKAFSGPGPDRKPPRKID